MKKLSLTFMLLLAGPNFTAGAGLSDWYNSAATYTNSAYNYAGQLANVAKEVAQSAYHSAYETYTNSHISEYATNAYNKVHVWASENMSHLSSAAKDKARSYLQNKAVDLMAGPVLDFVDSKVNTMLHDMVYKQNGVHVEDSQGKVIGHIYNDNSNFIRNLASNIGIDLNTLVPFLPGQKALWNFIENRFFNLTLLNKTIASKSIKILLGKKIKAAALKAVGAAMGLAESKILDLIASKNMSVTAEEEAQIEGLTEVEHTNQESIAEIDGIEISVDSSDEELSMLEQAVNHYVCLIKVKFNEIIERLVGEVANLAAANLAEKALQYAESATQTAVGVGATLVNPSFGVMTLLGLKADNEFNPGNTYSKSILQWLVGYETQKEILAYKASALTINLLDTILPESLRSTEEDIEKVYGKSQDIMEGDWEVVGFRDTSTIVSLTKITEVFKASFGSIASRFGQTIRKLFGNTVKSLEKVVETGRNVITNTAAAVETLTEEMPTFGHNIFDAEPDFDEEVEPSVAEKFFAWWNGTK